MVSCLNCGAPDDRYCGCWRDRLPGYAGFEPSGQSDKVPFFHRITNKKGLFTFSPITTMTRKSSTWVRSHHLQSHVEIEGGAWGTTSPRQIFPEREEGGSRWEK